ncbi:glycosyltransferase family 4 protein [Gryllotalpicola koreensis]|uniref:Glycosyltransferase n=1 Tax=Gryllotalpicola koreensis TaxID=993086 RepID=A0ABP7ZPF5_9MICO
MSPASTPQSLRLLAQRWSRFVPRGLRRRLRSLVPPPALDAAELVDGWSRPLLATAAAEAVGFWQRSLSEATLNGPDKGNGRAVPAEDVNTPRLRCLLVAPSMDVGGLDQMVAFLARELPLRGIDVAVLVTPESVAENPGRLGAQLRAEGVDVRELDRAGARAWLRADTPDIVAFHGGADWVLDEAEAIGAPVIEVHHGGHLLFGADPQALASRRQRLSGLIAVCELVRRQYLSLDPGCPPEFVTTIENGIAGGRLRRGDREAARRALGLSDERLLVSLSRHSLQKNTYGLAAAFGDVAAHVPEAHLVICGRVDDVDYASQVAALRSRMPGGDRLHLRDHTPHIADLLAAADGFVLDAFFEGGPLVSMEALASGVRVVLSETGAVREQIDGDARRGRMVSNPLGDPLLVDWERMSAARFARQENRDELVEAMVELVSAAPPSPAERERLRSESLTRFDQQRCADAHAAALRRAAMLRAR